MVLRPFGEAMLAGWLASIGVLALGYWPGGRAPGWQPTGEDVPTAVEL